MEEGVKNAKGVKRYASFNPGTGRRALCRLHKEKRRVLESMLIPGQVMDHGNSTGEPMPAESTSLRSSPSRRAKMKALPAGLRSLR